MQVGSEVPLKGGHLVRPFQTVHAVESQGYLIYHRKNKLKEEFRGANKGEIMAAKKQGIAITDIVEVRSSYLVEVRLVVALGL